MMRCDVRKSCSTASSSREGAVYAAMASSTPGPNICRPEGEVEGVLAILGPGPVGVEAHQPLQADLAHAGRHAAWFHRRSGEQRLLPLHARIAADAFLAHPSVRVEHRLLVGAGLDALLVPAGPLLVDQDDAALRPLVNGVARAGRQAGGMGAVVAEAPQVEKPDPV